MIILIFHLSLQTEFVIKESFTKEENFVKGTMFINDSNNLCFIVKNPLLQIVTFKAETTILYYPVHKKAFYITGLNPMDMPINKNILKTDVDFSKFGYRFLKKKNIGDTTITNWALPQKGMYLEMMNVKERVYKIVIKYKNKKLGEVIYDDYFVKENIAFPQLIKTISYTKKDTIIQEIVFKETKIIQGIPDSLINLKIPKDVEVKR